MVSRKVKIVGQLVWAVFIIALAANPSFANSVTLKVPGSADPYLSGMPNGSACCGGDSAPAQSPVQVLGLTLIPGTVLTFNVTGSMNFAGGTPTDHPDGDGFFGSGAPSNNGMGAINAPLDALFGVFLTNSLPTSSAAPAGLDFSAAGAMSFASLSPGLKQVFFIGDGRTGNGTGSVQTFIVPQGATRLFLGGGDAFGWFNNSGSFTVEVSTGTAVVPEPGTLLLVGTGLFGFLARRRLF